MNKQQNEFIKDLFKKVDPCDTAGIEKEIKATIKGRPGKISVVPTVMRTYNICKYLIKQSPFGYEGVKKFIPRDLRPKFEK